jgi:DNA-binding response OmpR family regulator
MKILIAEDDITSRNILKVILKKWGYEVIDVADGNEAWGVLQEEDAPRLIILDWMMPEIDGVTLCKKLREKKTTDPLYIILLTSKSDSMDLVEGLEAGADDYIAKPFNNLELQARVKAGRRILSLQDELLKNEKLQGVLEMAGAVCHEINQPLQSMSGYIELLEMNLSKNNPNYGILRKIKDGIERIGQLTRRIMGISRYKTKWYLEKTCKIVDIESASHHKS